MDSVGFKDELGAQTGRSLSTEAAVVQDADRSGSNGVARSGLTMPQPCAASCSAPQAWAVNFTPHHEQAAATCQYNCLV